MASIRKRQSGGRTRWQVRWRQGEQTKAETFGTEKQAVTVRASVDATHQRLLFRSWLARRSRTPELRPTCLS
jgi:hypothetical protein